MLGSLRATSGAHSLCQATTTARTVSRAFVPAIECKSERKARTESRHKRIRKKVSGTEERPRLAVFRSNQHIYAQVIDDTASRTLVAASSLSPEVKPELEDGNGATVAAAELVGKKLAELCKAKNIDKVAFDRGGFMYHGRIQALADGARAGGLNF